MTFSPSFASGSRTGAPALEVHLCRGGISESVHRVHAVVCDQRGRVLMRAGDPQQLSFIRSALKPFQAQVFVSSGAADLGGHDDRALAIAEREGFPADYEKLRADVTATPESISAALFAPEPRLCCDIAEWDGAPAGFAVWFLNFSTFRGRHGIYLEDLFVRPAFRGRGIGTALMQRLARRCVDDGFARFEWAVLDWNAPAIRFYEQHGFEIIEPYPPYEHEADAICMAKNLGDAPELFPY